MITFLNLGKYGRLGNQMFQIAGTIGLAVKYGYRFGFPAWMNYDHESRFHTDEDIYIQYYFKHPLPLVADGEYTPYNIRWGYWDLRPPDHVSLNGHMQSEKYFLHCADMIRHYFELKPLVNFTPPPGAICAHLRLGDYDNNYHPRLTAQYYSLALAQFPPGSPLFIFSDTPSQAKTIFGSRSAYYEKNHTMIDFYMMCQFKNFIIGNSTFSWWPAWLSGEKVIAPANWFGPMARISSKDIYCKGWKVI